VITDKFIESALKGGGVVQLVRWYT